MIHLRGVVRGNTIKFEADTGLTDGQEVQVTVSPALSPEEAIRRTAGAWAEDGEELDKYLEEVRRNRKQGRAEPSP